MTNANVLCTGPHRLSCMLRDRRETHGAAPLTVGRAPRDDDGAEHRDDAKHQRRDVPPAVLADTLQSRQLIEFVGGETLLLGVAPVELCINVLVLDYAALSGEETTSSNKNEKERCVLTMLKSSITEASTMPREKIPD